MTLRNESGGVINRLLVSEENAARDREVLHYATILTSEQKGKNRDRWRATLVYGVVAVVGVRNRYDESYF